MRRFLILLRFLPILLFFPLVTASSRAATDDEQLLQKYQIPTTGPALLDFFRARSATETQNKDLQKLIQQLGDDSYDLREEASKKLIHFGSSARNALLRAVKDPDLEIASRARKCLRSIEDSIPTSVCIAAAVRVLAQKQEPRTVEVLLGYLPFADDEEVMAAVSQALQTLAVHEGKVNPALIAALTDKTAVRRAVAGAALARARVNETLPAVRKLLTDPDVSVRVQVVQGLIAAGDKEAVGQLIDLTTVPGLSLRDAHQIHEYLCRLGDEESPLNPLGIDASARKNYQEAWKSWWKSESAHLTEEQIESATRPSGYTLVVLLDFGTIIDLDKNNRPRWQFRGLELPLDVQTLAGARRVLVAEHRADRVTERNRKGDILWTKEIEGPLVAQRLPSGNTFIATATRMVEVDSDGKELFNRPPKGGELIMKAVKLTDGDIACVVQAGLRGPTSFVRLNAKGDELKRFSVAMRTSGGRLEVLPNGNVLIPEMEQNRVVEYGKQGEIVWEGRASEPIAALRLPNGNTLVTSYTEGRAVELDRQSKVVWEYRNVTRVTRAFRR